MAGQSTACAVWMILESLKGARGPLLMPGTCFAEAVVQ